MQNNVMETANGHMYLADSCDMQIALLAGLVMKADNNAGFLLMMGVCNEQFWLYIDGQGGQLIVLALYC